MERDPFSELTRDVLAKREDPKTRKDLIEKISRIVYSYPRKHLRWGDDDAGDFFCAFYPKIDGLIDRFSYSGKPFEAYLIASIRWQLKTFAKKRAMHHSEEKAIQEETDFWYSCDIHDGQHHSYDVCYRSGTADPQERYSAEASKVLKIKGNGRITDPAWAKRFLYLVLRNVTFIDDSFMEHAAELSGYDIGYIVGCATELRERLWRKRERYAALKEKRNSLHVRILQLNTLVRRETETERLTAYKKQLETAKKRMAGISAEIRSANILPTHKDIAEVLGLSKGSVDSGLYYLRKAFDDFQMN